MLATPSSMSYSMTFRSQRRTVKPASNKIVQTTTAGGSRFIACNSFVFRHCLYSRLVSVGCQLDMKHQWTTAGLAVLSVLLMPSRGWIYLDFIFCPANRAQIYGANEHARIGRLMAAGLAS